MLPISILLPEKYKHIFLNHEKWHFLEFCISCRYVLCLFCWHKECANVIRSNQWPYNLVWSIKTPCNKKDMESITFCMTANIKAFPGYNGISRELHYTQLELTAPRLSPACSNLCWLLHAKPKSSYYYLNLQEALG